MDAKELDLFQAVIRARGSMAATRAWMKYLRGINDPRAEFIQTQLLIANAVQRSEGLLRLVKREQELLAEYREMWAPENCREMCTAVRYRNGMAVGLQPPWVYYNNKNDTAIRFIEGFGIHLLKGTGFSARGGNEGAEPIFSIRCTGTYDFLPDLANVMLSGTASFPLPGMVTKCDVAVDSRFCMVTSPDTPLQQFEGSYDRFDTPFARTVVTRELAKRTSRDQMKALAQAQREAEAREAARQDEEPPLAPPRRSSRRGRSYIPVDINTGMKLLPKANDRQREEIDDRVEDMLEDARRASPTNQTFDREIQL